MNVFHRCFTTSPNYKLTSGTMSFFNKKFLELAKCCCIRGIKQFYFVLGGIHTPLSMNTLIIIACFPYFILYKTINICMLDCTDVKNIASCRKTDTHCVLRVKAALVIEVGRFRPLVISLHNFLLMTSTRPPFSVTSW